MTAIRSIIAALLSRWWVILAASALAAGLAFVATQAVEQKASTASVRIGLTSASVWPRYQSDLESFANIVNQDDVRRVVQSTVPDQILSVETETVEGIFVVEVITTADTIDTAVAAAEQFAAIGIQRQAAEENGGQAAEFAALTDELIEIEAEIESLASAEAELLEGALALAAETDDEYSFEAEAVYRAAVAEASRATAERNAAEQRRRSVSNQLDDSELRAELSTERLFVVQDAQPVPTPNAVKGPLPVIAAAIAGALAAGAWVVGRDRLRGPVRSAEQVERVMDLAVVANMIADVDVYGGKRLRSAVQSVGQDGTVEIVLDEQVTADRENLCQAFQELVENSGGGRQGRFVVETLRAADGAVIVAQSGVTTVDSLARRVRRLEMSQVRLLGVVLI